VHASGDLRQIRNVAECGVSLQDDFQPAPVRAPQKKYGNSAEGCRRSALYLALLMPEFKQSILSEWTFGEAEPSSHCDTRDPPDSSGVYTEFGAIFCDPRRTGRGRPRRPARQAGRTKPLPSSTSILPEWTFGAAELSSHCNTRDPPDSSGVYTEFGAIFCDPRRTGRGRPRRPARQAGRTEPLPSSTSILPEWTFGAAELSSHQNTRELPNSSRFYSDLRAIFCDPRRTGRGRPRRPARQAGRTIRQLGGGDVATGDWRPGLLRPERRLQCQKLLLNHSDSDGSDSVQIAARRLFIRNRAS